MAVVEEEIKHVQLVLAYHCEIFWQCFSDRINDIRFPHVFYFIAGVRGGREDEFFRKLFLSAFSLIMSYTHCMAFIILRHKIFVHG